jgi:hypothetical protein
MMLSSSPSRLQKLSPRRTVGTNLRINSPRGSPQKQRNSSGSRNDAPPCLYWFVRYGRYYLLILIPFVIFSTTRQRKSPTYFAPDLTYQFQDAPIEYERPRKNIPDNHENNVFESSSIPSSYNATLHPVFPQHNFSPSSPMTVHLIVGNTGSVEPTSKFLMDGLERSSIIKVSRMSFLSARQEIKTLKLEAKAYHVDVVIVDWSSLHRDCHVLERILSDYQISEETKIVMMDYSASTRQITCKKYQSSTRLIKRQIVEGRKWDASTKWVHTGSIVDNHGSSISEGPTLHANFVVRERLVEAIFNMTTKAEVKKLPQKSRSTHVSFFWNKGDTSHYGQLRNTVATLVKMLDQSKVGSDKKVITTLAETVESSLSGGTEEGNIQKEYVRKLLKSKIVVVAQRDEFEDHLRLMDSLASGAMVATDCMHTLPRGLVNGTHILVYDSETSLKRILRYYLTHSDKRIEIATNGWKVAMRQHRSWASIEHIFFGDFVTHKEKPPYSLGPPKRDHKAIEMTSIEAFLN